MKGKYWETYCLNIEMHGDKSIRTSFLKPPLHHYLNHHLNYLLNHFLNLPAHVERPFCLQFLFLFSLFYLFFGSGLKGALAIERVFYLSICQPLLYTQIQVSNLSLYLLMKKYQIHLCLWRRCHSRTTAWPYSECAFAIWSHFYSKHCNSSPHDVSRPRPFTT